MRQARTQIWDWSWWPYFLLEVAENRAIHCRGGTKYYFKGKGKFK